MLHNDDNGCLGADKEEDTGNPDGKRISILIELAEVEARLWSLALTADDGWGNDRYRMCREHGVCIPEGQSVMRRRYLLQRDLYQGCAEMNPSGAGRALRRRGSTKIQHISEEHPVQAVRVIVRSMLPHVFKVEYIEVCKARYDRFGDIGLDGGFVSIGLKQFG